jgi:hypothetical protein
MAATRKDGDGLFGELSLGVLVVLGLFWSGITLLFDGSFFRDAFHQLRALAYSTTQGTVTETDLECISLDEGGSYRPIIKYSYSVAGKQYEGKRRRCDEVEFGPRTAQRIVDGYPVGELVTVYYAPQDPAEAVLRVGLEGVDLFNAMFMLPFNLIMLGLWVEGTRRVCDRLGWPQASRVGTWEDGDKLRVRLSAWQPLCVGAATAGALAFAAGFIVRLAFGSNPSMPVMLTVWAVILGGGLLAYALRRGQLQPLPSKRTAS